jgi:phosphatidylserine/phosphatidylglycerophosphate/cardiolipin synthase-like enzyme
VSYLRVTKRIHDRNEFDPLIDGETAYGELLKAMRAATRFIYIATWSIDPGLELTRTGSNDPTLREVLLEKTKAGLEIKVLSWDFLSVVTLGTWSALFRPDIGAFIREMAAAGAPHKRGSAFRLTTNPFKPDNPYNPNKRPIDLATGSHHQKFWLMDDAGKDPVGFVGGLNLLQHEWDTTEHRPNDNRRTAPGINRQGLQLQQAMNNPLLPRALVRGQVEQVLNDRFQLAQRIDAMPISAAEKALLRERIIDLTIAHLMSQKPLATRHDITSRIRGPAAGELLEEFRVRWRIAGAGTLEEKPGKLASPSGATTRLQIGHTAYYKELGDKFDCWRSYLHALRKAQSYVYLENQYFTAPSVRNALVDRMRRSAKLELVVVLPNKAEEFHLGPGIALRQSQNVEAIRAAARSRTPGKDRVHVFGLSQWNGASNAYEDIYVHAKVGIIDDKWMTIGSTNCSSRSFEWDTELNAFTDDAATIAAFRKELWSEHLEVAKDDPILRDSMRAIARMAETAAANAKLKSGELKGRLVPMKFDLPPWWLHRYYEDLILKEFF